MRRSSNFFYQWALQVLSGEGEGEWGEGEPSTGVLMVA